MDKVRDGFHEIEGKFYRVTNYESVFTVRLNQNVMGLRRTIESWIDQSGPTAKRVLAHARVAEPIDYRVMIERMKAKKKEAIRP